MSTRTSHAPGNFCWFELATSDQNAAKEFYSSIFGWVSDDQPMGPDQFYTMLKVDEKNVGALFGMSKEEMGSGIPPHWGLYISVESVDETAKKAESLGGKIIMAPFDVMDVGRMAVIQDPTGAIFSIWQASKHLGAGLIGEPGAFCWWELNTKDPSKAKEFYTQLFGWTIGGDADYTEWKNGSDTIGGMMEIRPEWGPVPPNWLSYVQVKNCDETAAKIKELGGSVMMGPQDIPNMGRFAVASDPQRAVFAIYQPNTK